MVSTSAPQEMSQKTQIHFVHLLKLFQIFSLGCSRLLQVNRTHCTDSLCWLLVSNEDPCCIPDGLRLLWTFLCRSWPEVFDCSCVRCQMHWAANLVSSVPQNFSRRSQSPRKMNSVSFQLFYRIHLFHIIWYLSPSLCWSSLHQPSYLCGNFGVDNLTQTSWWLQRGRWSFRTLGLILLPDFSSS